ncbi:late embryogenesis abundant protein 6-like, partial [Phalaenopsis equestris]|uniref:late embryogenesis abundant protein 6-like n=1 Tax=Phalaenopsis equestris TaxID=78828 RepID=UPI0009E20408
MQFAKEKMNDMASKSKEKKEIRHAIAEEKAEKKGAKTREEKEIAHELSKARQAEAKMEYHLEKAEHRAETLAHRAAGKNHLSAQSVLNSGGGGGAFYNAQGQPVGGMPARPTGVGAVDAVRPSGVGAAGPPG